MGQLGLAATVLAALGLVSFMSLARSRVASWPLGPIAAALACAISAAVVSKVNAGSADSLDTFFLYGCLLAPALLLPLLFKPIRWPGGLFLAGLITASFVYVAALIRFTFFGGLSPIGLFLSTLLLLLELCALLFSISFGYEMADALARDEPLPLAPEGSQDYCPQVCLQVPAYNEPPELLRETLAALSRLDYPDYIVQVVVNNTTEPALWQPVEAMCQELGPRFQFIHLPKWPGYKAGALNEATRRLPKTVEVVGIVDADYVVHPDFLSRCIPYLADPSVAFVQTPQHYRDWQDSSYLRGLFHAYRYFFDVTMVARSRVNSIIFGGTMGLIRRSALYQIGGWAEWCITEDAEASLRLLATGWKSVYLHQPFGEGLMPLDFDGLRRQRFRWAFGGIQILRRHLPLMLGITPSRLNLAQRYHHLMGALGWFGEPLSVALGLFLLLVSPFLALGHPLLLRQLAGVILVMPLFLLVSGLARLGWGLKLATAARWRDVPFAMTVMLALSWTVTRACVYALIRERGVFLRTPKLRSPSRLGRTLVSTAFESTLSLAFLIACPLLLVLGPQPLASVISVMLAWQAFAWGSAPLASLTSQGIRLTPARLVFRRSPQNTGARAWSWPVESRNLLIGPAIAIGLTLLLVPPMTAGGSGDEGLINQLGLPPSTIKATPSTRTPVHAGGAYANPTPRLLAPAPSIGAGATPSVIPSGGPAASPTPHPTPRSSHSPRPNATPNPTPSPT